MDLYSGNVRLKGRLDQVVHKTGLTAAEILVLRTIHGHDAVVDIKNEGSHQRTYADEYERLCINYGDAVCNDVWPGAQKVLPAKIDDIQVVGEEPTSYTVVGSNFHKQSAEAQAGQLARQQEKGGLPYVPPLSAA